MKRGKVPQGPTLDKELQATNARWEEKRMNVSPQIPKFCSKASSPASLCGVKSSLVVENYSKSPWSPGVSLLEPGGVLNESKPLPSMPTRLITLLPYWLLAAGNPTGPTGPQLKSD